MALHILQSPERFAACQAALTASDTLLLVDRGVLMLNQTARSALRNLPCPVMILNTDLLLSGLACDEDVAEVIDNARWVDLTEQYPQVLSWY